MNHPLMKQPLSRRILLGSAAGLAAAATLPAGLAQAAPRTATVPFVLNAEVLDGGEQVVALTLDAHALGPIDASSITTATFTVHALAESPLVIPDGEMIFNLFDGERRVTEVSIDQKCQIVLTLEHGESVAGGATLGYLLKAGRNVQLDLTYTITVATPIRLRNGRSVSDVTFVQAEGVVNPEVDAYSYGVSSGGMNYRLHSPSPGASGSKGNAQSGNRYDLIVWLHGAGEGGMRDGTFYTNETQLRGNRGALGFSTPAAQEIFGGAYVLAPQCKTWWLDDIYTTDLKACIDEVVAKFRIDPSRVHVVGCSNGGFMSMEMAQAYPDFFASSVPICPAIYPFTTEDIRRLEYTPTWFVAAENDPVVPAETNAVYAHELVPSSILTLYPNVVWDGYEFNGHWSWIYVAHNDPVHDGVHIWNWMAAQSR